MSKQIKRRTLIKNSMMLASSYALLGGCSSSGSSSGSQTPAPASTESILVVGAGMAGLSAANALHALGHQVTVLEGRNRLGGRIWTNRSLPGAALDMGASWIHGIEDNPIADLVRQHNIATLPTDYDNSVLYNFDGTQFSDSEESVIEARFESVLEETVIANCIGSDSTLSLQEALDPIVASKNYSDQERLEFNYALNSAIEQETSGASSDLSTCHFFAGSAFDGEDVVFPGGYDQVINQLAQGLEIRLEHIVQSVEYNDAGVTVTTDQGVFRGDRVIVTLPVGVLKKGSVTFTPELPAEKQASIEKLGMGVLNKVYLRFPNTFWDSEEWIGRVPQNHGEWAVWFNLNHYIQDSILLAFNAADFGRNVESLSDDDITQATMEMLRTIYGESIPTPEGTLISRWASDPFAYGSYSYMATNATLEDRDVLAAPVNNRLLFAGEATSSYASTVHGAYLSGQREAQRIDPRVSARQLTSARTRPLWKPRNRPIVARGL